MNAGLIMLAVFAGVVVVLGGVVLHIRNKVRRFSRDVFGTDDITQAFAQIEKEEQERPKSLNGMDMMYLPQIKKDFPDFNVEMADQYAKDALRNHVGAKEAFKVHNVVISGYRKASIEKTIIMQAAVEWVEDGHKVQKRYIMHYAYQVVGTAGDNVVAANCPNCGGAIESLSWTKCPYCECRLVNVLETSWKFTSIQEG